MRGLAAQFNREKGIKPDPDFFHGDYYDLDRAVIIGNQSDIEAALRELLLKKSRKDIETHYRRFAGAPFTGKLSRESEFRATLSPEQRDAYDQAKAARSKRQQQVIEALGRLR